MTQLAARELINNGWFITSLCLTGIFIAFLIQEMRCDGWYAKLRNQAALALLVYFIGETIARGWGALLLWHYTTGQEAYAIEERYPIAMAGAALSFIGAVCCVRVFSPPSWGHLGWVGVMAIAAVFMLVTYVW